jgi:hypothetical protein
VREDRDTLQVATAEQAEAPPCCWVAAAVVVFEDERLGNRIVGQFRHVVVSRADGRVGRSVAISALTPALNEKWLSEHVHLQGVKQLGSVAQA